MLTHASWCIWWDKKKKLISASNVMWFSGGQIVRFTLSVINGVYLRQPVVIVKRPG